MPKPKQTGWTMIDFETLGLFDDAIILQLGMCYFSNEELAQGHLNGTSELNLDSCIDRAVSFKFNVEEQIALGRKTNKSTIAWWKTQPQHVIDKVVKENPKLDISIHQIFDVLQAYHIKQGTTLKNTRLVDRRHYDISKLQHIYTVTMGKDSEQRVELPYNPYVTWEVSQMFQLFTGCRYANIKADEIQNERFDYHDAGSDAALEAYRFITTFAGNTEM